MSKEKEEQPLYTAAALATVKHEGELFTKRLEQAGLLGLRRPVRVLASAASPAAPAASPGEKIVHFVRHGQGFHNLLADLYREAGKQFDSESGAGGESNPYCRPEVLDPPLTEVGRRQARQLQPVARGLSPQVVVVSPHVRATQTALIGFAHLVEGSATKVPFVAHEGCREIMGVHTCDRRRPVSELRCDFPMVNYEVGGIPEEDVAWSATERETLRALADRGHGFLLWLRDRPEREIVVASHFAWLFTLFSAAMECESDALRAPFCTGEMRSVALRFASGDESSEGQPYQKRARTE